MPTPKRLSATDAARSFSDVVARVHYRGEEFVIEKGGEVVCRISPVGQGAAKSTIGDLLALFETMSAVDDDYRYAAIELTRKQSKLPRSLWE